MLCVHAFGNILRMHKGEMANVWLTALLLCLGGRVCPSALIAELALQAALAPEQLFDFLRAVRAFRSPEGPFARNKRLSHGGRVLRGAVLLLQVAAPQRGSSCCKWWASGAVKVHVC